MRNLSAQIASYGWTDEQRHFLRGLDEALDHQQAERKAERLAARRVRAAEAHVERQRAIFLRNIPSGAGLAVAKSCPWGDIYWSTHSQRWVVSGGSSVSDVATDLVELARILGEPVSAEHNGVPVQANPGDTRAAILDRFQETLAARRLERVNR